MSCQIVIYRFNTSLATQPNDRTYLARASIDGIPWFLITEPSGLAKLCGIAGDNRAECAAAGCGNCINCM